VCLWARVRTCIVWGLLPNPNIFRFVVVCVEGMWNKFSFNQVRLCCAARHGIFRFSCYERNKYHWIFRVLAYNICHLSCQYLNGIDMESTTCGSQQHGPCLKTEPSTPTMIMEDGTVISSPNSLHNLPFYKLIATIHTQERPWWIPLLPIHFIADDKIRCNQGQKTRSHLGRISGDILGLIQRWRHPLLKNY